MPVIARPGKPGPESPLSSEESSLVDEPYVYGNNDR